MSWSIFLIYLLGIIIQLIERIVRETINRTILLLCLIGIATNFIIEIDGARLSGEEIRGGDDAVEGSYTYQVSVQAQGNIHVCGGTIIAERFVVTAAHCVVNPNGEFYGFPLKVVAGTVDLLNPSSTDTTVDVVRIFVLNEYNPVVDVDLRSADIAVLQLGEDLGIESNRNLGKVSLPKPNEDYVGVKAVVTGFGFNSVEIVFYPETGEITETNGQSTKKLRHAEAIVIDKTECDKKSDYPITPKHLCASVVQRVPKVPEGVCTGDSGGPLVYNNILIGVVSVSPLACREDRQPATYTRVSSFMDFINNAVKNHVTNEMRSIDL